MKTWLNGVSWTKRSNEKHTRIKSKLKANENSFNLALPSLPWPHIHNSSPTTCTSHLHTTHKKDAGDDLKCTMPPWLCNSTRSQYTLQMFTDRYSPRHTIPWNTINRDCCNHKGSCTLVSPYLLSQPDTAPRISYEFLRDNYQWAPCPTESQARSIFTRTLVLTAWTRTRNLSHRKRAPYSICLFRKKENNSISGFRCCDRTKTVIRRYLFPRSFIHFNI